MNRKEMVRLAGMARHRPFATKIRLELDRAYHAFGRQLAVYWWGPPGALLPTVRVSVPRSLRRTLGRYSMELKTTGRKRKDRRRHNRRWMPDQEDES